MVQAVQQGEKGKVRNVGSERRDSQLNNYTVFFPEF